MYIIVYYCYLSQPQHLKGTMMWHTQLGFLLRRAANLQLIALHNCCAASTGAFERQKRDRFPLNRAPSQNKNELRANGPSLPRKEAGLRRTPKIPCLVEIKIKRLFHPEISPKFGIISGPSWSMPPAMRTCPFLGSSSDNQGMLHANFGGFKPGRYTWNNPWKRPRKSCSVRLWIAFHPSFPWKASYVRRRLHWDFGCRTSGGFSGKKCSIFKCLHNLRCLAKLVNSICMP